MPHPTAYTAREIAENLHVPAKIYAIAHCSANHILTDGRHPSELLSRFLYERINEVEASHGHRFWHPQFDSLGLGQERKWDSCRVRRFPEFPQRDVKPAVTPLQLLPDPPLDDHDSR